jgi:hypothetical protein
MEVEMDDKDAINKQSTADRDRDRESEFEIAGNVREKGQDPSPDNRKRGEFSDGEPESEGGTGGTKRS